MHWGQAVREVRVARGWTQQELGDKIGKHQSEIARWERATDMMTSTLELLAAGLRISCEELTRRAEAASADPEEA